MTSNNSVDNLLKVPEHYNGGQEFSIGHPLKQHNTMSGRDRRMLNDKILSDHTKSSNSIAPINEMRNPSPAEEPNQFGDLKYMIKGEIERLELLYQNIDNMMGQKQFQGGGPSFGSSGVHPSRQFNVPLPPQNPGYTTDKSHHTGRSHLSQGLQQPMGYLG